MEIGPELFAPISDSNPVEPFREEEDEETDEEGYLKKRILWKDVEVILYYMPVFRGVMLDEDEDKVFTLQNKHLVLTTILKTGHMLWPASAALTQFIFQFNHLFKNKKVLELGSGAGNLNFASSRF
jgi:hypothetical protein